VKKTPSANKSNVTVTEILDLSSGEECYVASKPARRKATSPSESAYGNSAKPSGNESHFTKET
jgi:hypothetical protein